MRESSLATTLGTETDGGWVNSVMGVLRWRERNNNRQSQQDKTNVNLSTSPTIFNQV